MYSLGENMVIVSDLYFFTIFGGYTQFYSSDSVGVKCKKFVQSSPKMALSNSHGCNELDL